MDFVLKWQGKEHWEDLKSIFKNTFGKTYKEADKIIREYKDKYPINERIKNELEIPTS